MIYIYIINIYNILKMEKILFQKISSKYLAIYIFGYIEDENFLLKLVKYSKSIQKTLDLKLYDYKEKYICQRLIKYIHKKNINGKKDNALFDLLEKEILSEVLLLSNKSLNNFDNNDYKELKKKEDETEIEWCEKFWNNYKSSNISIISDLFSGLLKSDAICSECKYGYQTFSVFNSLSIAMSSQSYIYNKKAPYKDIELFYIPKFSIKKSCRIRIHVKNGLAFKNMAEEINKIKNFKFKLKKLVYIKVSDSQFKEIINVNESKNDKIEFIFAFDDETKEGIKNKIIPLYFFKKKEKKEISAFPRLLFLKENMNFFELKKLIYFFARKYFKSPFINRKNNEENEDESEIYNIDEELEKYITEDQDTNNYPYDEKKLWKLLDKEYNEIFNDNKKDNYKEELEKFFNDFPYEITIKNNFNDIEHFTLFNGKNNFENLKVIGIAKDEDPITFLFNNKNNCLNLILNSFSLYSVKNINLNYCENFTGVNYRQKYKVDIVLDDLLEYYFSNENITKENENERECNNCKIKQKITKKISLFYLPRLLIIILKRVSGDETEVKFPLENLKFRKYIYKNSPDNKFSKYDLLAFSYYQDIKDKRYYTAITKNINGQWYYNDSHASIEQNKIFECITPYIFIFKRKNC